jgi:hypothetical protein
MVGGTNTVNTTPGLVPAAVVTVMGPVVAPVGTATMMAVLLQLVGVASVPLKLTVLLPWVAPKLIPLMVTDVPTGPELGDKPLTSGPFPAILKVVII